MASNPKTTAHKDGQDSQGNWTRKAMSFDEECVRRGMLAYEATREGLIQDLKTAVWAGSYNPALDGVADAIIAEREAERNSMIAEAEAVAKMGEQTAE